MSPEILSAAGHDEVIAELKATAHLRLADGSNTILVAGAGMVDINGGGAGEQYEASPRVMILLQERQQLQGNRLEAHVSNVCPIPPHLSFEDAAAMVYPFKSSLDVLHREMGVSVGSMKPDDEVEEVKTALILGGESAVGNALIQLLRMFMPSTDLIVTCRAEEEAPKEWEEAVRPFCSRAVELGAKYAIDASAPDLLGHLQAAIPMYGDSLKMTFDATGEFSRRPELLGLLEASGIVDCTRKAIDPTLFQESDRLSMTDLGLILAGHELRPPLCNDMFVTAL